MSTQDLARKRRLVAALAGGTARFGFSLAGVLTLLSLTACGSERGADQWPISRGELAGKTPTTGAKSPEGTYRQYCIGCHGADGRGNGGTTGADFTGPNSPLRAHGDGELIASVRDGKRGVTATMPAHSPVLSEAQIAELIGYLRSRFQQ
jgi:mono/diheme cytochrome c family protein